MVLSLGNATGYAELLNGSIGRAAWKAIDAPLTTTGAAVGYSVLIIILTVLAILLVKTRSPALVFGVGVLAQFILYNYIPVVASGILITALVLLLAASLYSLYKSTR